MFHVDDGARCCGMSTSKDLGFLPDLHIDDERSGCDKGDVSEYRDKSAASVSKSTDNSDENCHTENAEHAGDAQPARFAHCDATADRISKKSTPRHHTVHATESDGGWGWIIVFGVFCITLLIGGVSVSFSLLYLEFVELFGTSRAVAGWIGSVHMFTTNILGIITFLLL